MEEPRSFLQTLYNLLMLAVIGAVFLLPRDFIAQFGHWGQKQSAAIAQEDVPADTADDATADAAGATIEVRYTTAGSLNMRAAPSTNGAVVASLPRGTRVAVTDTEGSWLFVKTDNGVTGWINNRFASLDAPR